MKQVCRPNQEFRGAFSTVYSEHQRSENTWVEAQRAAIICASIGQFAVFIVTGITPAIYRQITVESVLYCIYLHLFGFGMMTLPIGIACAWISYRWFYRTTISVTLMAIVIASVVDVTLIGWMVEFFFLSIR